MVRGRKGEYRKELAELPQAWLSARPGRRRDVRDRGRSGTRQETQA
ncbi:MAG: hypothetical protein ACMVO3_15285 [Thalassobaculum sp.]